MRGKKKTFWHLNSLNKRALGFLMASTHAFTKSEQLHLPKQLECRSVRKRPRLWLPAGAGWKWRFSPSLLSRPLSAGGHVPFSPQPAHISRERVGGILLPCCWVTVIYNPHLPSSSESLYLESLVSICTEDNGTLLLMCSR